MDKTTLEIFEKIKKSSNECGDIITIPDPKIKQQLLDAGCT